MDARVGARWMIERARAAAAAGLDSLFVGDHHNVPVPYYQNVPILGRLLAEWDDATRRRAVPAAALASRCCSPSRSGRSRPSRRARSSCSARSAAGTSSFGAFGLPLRSGRLVSKRARRDPAALRRRGGVPPSAVAHRARPHRAGPAASRWRCGSARPRPSDRPGRPARRRVPHRPGSDAGGGRRARRAVSRRVRARHGRSAAAHRRATRHPRRRGRRRTPIVSSAPIITRATAASTRRRS